MDADQRQVPGGALPRQPLLYTCGNCGLETEIKPKEPIHCHDCGHRILYKNRTKRMVQFDAR